MKKLRTLFVLILFFLAHNNISAQACIVGGACYENPSQAFQNAKDGDVIEVHSGTYYDVGV